MRRKWKRLRVPIPLDYAGVLDCDPTHLCHINAGRRSVLALPPKQLGRVVKLLEMAREDGRLDGLKLLDLVPDLKVLLQAAREEILEFLP